MFDRDLAFLYKVTTGALNQAVKRNRARFPDDFMFQLNKSEFKNWISQIVISGMASVSGQMGIRRIPYVFTEQGVAMLSSVLKSETAIQVNVQIIRTFVRIRELVVSNKELRNKLEELEKRYDSKFEAIFNVIKNLLNQPEYPVKEIGFKE